MKNFKVVAIMMSLSGILTSPVTVTTQQAAASRNIIHKYVTWIRPSSDSLNAYLRHVDAVLFVRVVSNLGTRAIPGPQGKTVARLTNPALEDLPDLIREYRVEVLQIAKAHPLATVSTVITISRFGGELDWLSGYRIVAHEDGIPLVSGAEYLMFLNYREDIDALTLSPFGVFRVEGGIVRGSFHTQGFLSELTSQPSATALEAIQAAQR